MLISSALDYREAAKRKLPLFLFDYIDGGAYAEHTLKANTTDLAGITLRQRIMLALGAKGVLLGRATAYSLAAEGQAGVENMLTIFANEIRVAMALTGVTSISQVDKSCLIL